MARRYDLLTVMQLSRVFMLERGAARDARFDGRFLVCVRSTGIYCRPSCKAKSPKPENVRHCTTPAQAEAMGFRACRRCRPDDFHAGRDRDRDALLAATAALRATPGGYSGAAAYAARVGCGATKLTELCRRHFHRTPADVVVAARIAFAEQRLAGTRSSVLEVGLDAGFTSSSAFHDNFRAHTGTTPRAFRQLLRDTAFALTLPPGFPVADFLHWFDRAPGSVCERRLGNTLHLALLLDDRPAVLSLQFTATIVRCRVQTARAPSPEAMRSAHTTVVRLLNLAGDPRPARTLLRRDARIVPLLRARPGLRVFQHQSPFACLLWAILGQQVHLRLAARLRATVVRAVGRPIGDLIAHPDAATVAALDAADLRAACCSRQKTDCLLGAAAAIAGGSLDFAALAAGSAPLAATALEALPGIGPWSSQYVLLRGLGFADALPAGDAGLAAAMQRLFTLPERPDATEQQRLAAPFAPHRGLFTFHLWHTLGDAAVADNSGERIRKNARAPTATIIAS